MFSRKMTDGKRARPKYCVGLTLLLGDTREAQTLGCAFQAPDGLAQEERASTSPIYPDVLSHEPFACDGPTLAEHSRGRCKRDLFPPNERCVPPPMCCRVGRHGLRIPCVAGPYSGSRVVCSSTTRIVSISEFVRVAEYTDLQQLRRATRSVVKHPPSRVVSTVQTRV